MVLQVGRTGAIRNNPRSCGGVGQVLGNTGTSSPPVCPWGTNAALLLTAPGKDGTRGYTEKTARDAVLRRMLARRSPRHPRVCAQCRGSEALLEGREGKTTIPLWAIFFVPLVKLQRWKVLEEKLHVHEEWMFTCELYCPIPVINRGYSSSRFVFSTHVFTTLQIYISIYMYICI